MNNQIDATYDGQATYPIVPTKREAAPQTQIKVVKLSLKKPTLTEYPLTSKEPTTLSESLDHYLYW